MKRSPLALSLTLALLAPVASAADASHQPVAATPTSQTRADVGSSEVAPADANRADAQAKELSAVEVTATMNRARNALSPGTGSSQYVIGKQAIAQLPLGASTPINQVLLQAPGVVQDSHGGLHVRGDHANLQYRINGVFIPESISGFGQTLDTRTIANVKLLDGALPAQYGERTAAVVDITTRSGSRLGNGGSIGITGGSFATLNPDASIWGSTDRWSWYVTANWLQSDDGIENPTASRKPIHDHTTQLKSFADISYRINDQTRVSLLLGAGHNHFQIPNNPNQVPQFGYMDRTEFDSADLHEQQNETTRFGVLALQGKLGRTDYQVSLGQRYSSLDFQPDRIGNLMFNGVAAHIQRSNRATTLQADFSMPLGNYHTLRYGVYGSHERAPSVNDAWVFPADAGGKQISTSPIHIVDHDSVTARTMAAYIQDEWSIGDKLTVNYGVRANRYAALRTESALSPRVGLVYQATDNTVVHAGYSHYFTPPASEAITASNIAKFDGTTNQLPDNGNNTPLSERSDYFDVGVQRQIGNSLTLGLDAYYREVKRLQDEGQFGAALVYSTFNFADGRIRGIEFTGNYDHGPLSAYFNLAASRAMGRHVITSQYNFDPDDLAYILDHYIHLDHDQKLTSSGGVSYRVDGATTVGANYLFGSGLRKDGDVPNGLSMPAYFQLNLNVAHDFDLGRAGKVHAQLALINALDRTFELRDGSGIGVGAPQFGPRRSVFLSIRKAF